MMLYIAITATGCVCILTMIYLMLCRPRNMKIVTVEPGLRVYSKIMSTLSLTIPLSTVIVSVFVLFGNDFNARLTVYLRLSVLFTSQLLDITAFVILVDCAVASRKIDRTPLLRKRVHGYCAAVISVVYAFCIPILLLIPNFNNGLYISLFKLILDIVCLLTELTLLTINNRQKKKVPYAYNLSIRHNLVRNIKMLQFICPFLILITVTNAVGPVIYICNSYTKVVSAADSGRINFLLFNVTMLFAIFLYTIKSNKKSKIVQKTVTVLELEKQRVTVDHFETLKSMWN